MKRQTRLTVGVALACVFLACLAGAATQTASTTVFETLRLLPGQKQSFSFVVPAVPSGREAVLVLDARLDAPRPSGYTPALRLQLNGTALEGRRLVNKPLRAKANSGRFAAMAAGDRLTTYYSPDFTSPDAHSQYGLVDAHKTCQFALRVSDLVRDGRNELVVENAAAAGANRPLVAALARVEFRPPVASAAAAGAAPTGPLPVCRPRPVLRTAYRLESLPLSQLRIGVGGEEFLVESFFSTPKPEWTRGSNEYFKHERRVEPGAEAVVVSDTFTNLSGSDLAIVQRHEIGLPAGTRRRVWLAGIEQPLASGVSSDSANPTALVATASAGAGLVALSDAFRLHVRSFAEGNRLGLADEQLVIPAGGQYTARWAIVPVDEADYWTFINVCRRLVGANFTIPGGFAFLRAAPPVSAWSDAETRDFLIYKDAYYAAAHLPSRGSVPAHGTAFQQLPIDDYRAQFARRRRLVPSIKNLVYFHCFLDVAADSPQRFADARTLLPSGVQADYGQPVLRLFVPTDKNSFGPAVAKNVDIILDEIGADGVYWDEHEFSRVAYHYGQPWDGVSGDIDRGKLTVVRRKSSVALVTEAWRLALARRILSHGVLVGNGPPRTEAMAALQFPCFVETGSISNCTRAHLYSPIALGDHLSERSELDAYGTMLAALDFGCLYHWYHDVGVVPTHHHLTRYMYPFTPLELHGGYVIGKERIVTRSSGLFGWGDNSRHEVHAFDAEGRERHDFAVPHVSREGATYSELRLPDGWSAVIIRQSELGTGKTL